MERPTQDQTSLSIYEKDITAWKMLCTIFIHSYEVVSIYSD